MQDKTMAKLISAVQAAAGVPVIRAPATSAGEKIILRTAPGKHDGDWETFTVILRFISRDVSVADARCAAVTERLCSPGDEPFGGDGSAEFVIRKSGGGSSYIGRTGHHFVLAHYEVRRRAGR